MFTYLDAIEAITLTNNVKHLKMIIQAAQEKLVRLDEKDSLEKELSEIVKMCKQLDEKASRLTSGNVSHESRTIRNAIQFVEIKCENIKEIFNY